MKVLECMHISDTHETNIFEVVANSISETGSNPLDILFISGDLTYKGKLDKLKQVYEQLEYLLMMQMVKEVVMIPGNHDLSFERRIGYECRANAMAIFAKDKRIHVLIHEARTVQGLKIFGSAWTPFFHDWAFNYHVDMAADLWNQIPNDTELLITHGPPNFILDEVKEYMKIRHCGCPMLRYKVMNTPSIKYHLFGHIHEGYGRTQIDGVTYLNSCIMDGRYKPTNKPQYFEVGVHED